VNPELKILGVPRNRDFFLKIRPDAVKPSILIVIYVVTLLINDNKKNQHKKQSTHNEDRKHIKANNINTIFITTKHTDIITLIYEMQTLYKNI